MILLGKKFKIKTKLIFVFTLVLVLTAGTLGVSILFLTNSGKDIENVNQSILPAVTGANNAKDDMMTLEKNITNILLTEDTELQDTLKQQNVTVEKQLEEKLNAIKGYVSYCDAMIDDTVKVLNNSKEIREKVESLSDD